jgi:Kef-type K+ transport system membrane component KefB
MFLMVTAAAIVGKVGGTALAARLLGEPWRWSLALGALVQTKGLMEVVVLTIFRDEGVITDHTFSALMLMALATTALTMPLVRLILGDSLAERPTWSDQSAGMHPREPGQNPG